MSMSRTKSEGYSYDSSGRIQYHLLYPLLNSYWNKSLADMPPELRLRVEYVAPRWDLDDCSDQRSNYPSQLTNRQKLIKLHDWQRDTTQEYETYIALRDYIQSTLQIKINKAISKDMASVAVALRHRVALPLEKIRSKEGIHWPKQEPLLWCALCRFSRLLPSISDKALGDEDSNLVLALDEVSIDIYKILNIDRWRVGIKIESELEAEAAEHATPVFEKNEGRILVTKQQDHSILKWLRENGHDPLQLPAGEKGKPGVRKLCGDGVCNKKDNLFSSRSVFYTAWDRLRVNVDTKVEG